MALHEAFQAYQGLWFGWSGKVAAHPAVHPKIIDKGQVQYAVMDLTSLDRQEYYNGFANRALWPIMHYRIGLSEFSRADYAGYLRVNRSFASALAHLIQPRRSCLGSRLSPYPPRERVAGCRHHQPDRVLSSHSLACS